MSEVIRTVADDDGFGLADSAIPDIALNAIR